MGGTETPSLTAPSPTAPVVAISSPAAPAVDAPSSATAPAARAAAPGPPRSAGPNDVISTRAGAVSGLVRTITGSRPVPVPGPTNQNSFLGGLQRARDGARPGAPGTVTVALSPAATGPLACTASGTPPFTWTSTPRARAGPVGTSRTAPPADSQIRPSVPGFPPTVPPAVATSTVTGAPAGGSRSGHSSVADVTGARGPAVGETASGRLPAGGRPRTARASTLDRANMTATVIIAVRRARPVQLAARAARIGRRVPRRRHRLNSPARTARIDPPRSPAGGAPAAAAHTAWTSRPGSSLRVRRSAWAG